MTTKCDILKVCGYWGKWYNAGDRRRKSGIHICHEVTCYSCQEFVEPGHLCFMKPSKVDVSRDGEDEMSDDEFEGEQMGGENVEKGFKFLFFDFETVEDVGHIHVPNMCEYEGL